MSEAAGSGWVGGAFVKCFIINGTDKSSVYIIVVHWIWCSRSRLRAMILVVVSGGHLGGHDRRTIWCVALMANLQRGREGGGGD